MALRCGYLLRKSLGTQKILHNVYSTAIPVVEHVKNINKAKEFRTEDNLVYYQDPDKFGTLSRKLNPDKVVLEDEGDIKEEKLTTDLPLSSQRLTTRQYADIIKQYLKHKRLKEAINVLEVRMLQEDRVKPENYIYNILIGACAEVGYTKKAFKLFNDMKRRALQPTGDTYTCLFHSCFNSPWPSNGLKLATHLRELMIEKGIEPNLTNYNSMIKAFGRCGDLPTAFKMADEMVSKGIKIRVHTFNHLLQGCISDKNNGLRHALIVWRKMLKMREKPNIYSFNLMLKCVKECNLGSQADIEDLISVLKEHIALEYNRTKTLQLQSGKQLIEGKVKNQSLPLKHINFERFDSTLNKAINVDVSNKQIINNSNVKTNPHNEDIVPNLNSNAISVIDNHVNLVQIVTLPKKDSKERTLPNLLSQVLQMQQVLSLQAVNTVQDKFAVVGGMEDFLKEMEVYSVKPDVKTFTLIVPLLDDTIEAENKLLSTIKALDVRVDIDFYNMLIKKRCMRSEYDTAFEIMKIIKKEAKLHIKRFPDRKHLHLKPNIMTYGVLAMACKTKESAEQLLNDMKEAKIKVNIEILGTLLRHGTAHTNFGYVLYIMNLVKDGKLQPNPIFLKHLEAFDDKCRNIIKSDNCSEVFLKSFKIFSMAHKNWLKDINIEDILKEQDPWAQFNETYPETIQRSNFTIKQPKKFYKRNKKYVKYIPTVA